MFSLSLLTKSIRLYFKKIIRTCHLLCKIPNANTAPARHKLQREHFYRPQRSWAKVMFLQASVILSTGEGGVYLSGCWDTTSPEQTPPWEQTPHLGADTPPGADTPGTDTPGTDTPPHKETPAYGQRTAGTHPTGMHSCLFKFWRTKVLFVRLLITLFWTFGFKECQRPIHALIICQIP